MAEQPTTPQDTAAAEPNKARNLILKLVAIVVVVGAAALYGNHTIEEIKLRSQYNAYVTHLMDNGHYAAAIDCFEALEQEATGESKKQVQDALAQCYVMLARATADDADQQLTLLAQGYALNPAMLDDVERAMIGK